MGIGVEILQFRVASKIGQCGVEDWREEARGCLWMEVFSQFYGGGNGNLLVSWRDWWLVVAMVYFLFSFLLLCWLYFLFFHFSSFASEVKLDLKILMIE